MEYLRKMSYRSLAEGIMIASVHLQAWPSLVFWFYQGCPGSFVLVLVEEIVLQVGNNKSVHLFCQAV
jgi:hypothetical protein